MVNPLNSGVESGDSGVGGSGTNKRRNFSGNRTDPRWEYAIEVDKHAKKVKCRYCGLVRSGGIFRFKHHLAGTNKNIEACKKVPEDVRQKFVHILITNFESSNAKKQKLYASLGHDYESQEAIREECQRGKGTMKDFVVKSKNQATLNHIFKKRDREKVYRQIALFFYTSAIPFNCVRNPQFARMLDDVGRFGIGLKPPSYNDIRVKFLEMEVNNTMDMLEDYKKEWKKTGCTIMSDGSTDRKRRSICNFLVNSPKGIVFLTSIDTSEISKIVEKICEMLDEVVEKVKEHVVQVVTNNAANYKLVREMLMD